MKESKAELPVVLRLKMANRKEGKFLWHNSEMRSWPCSLTQALASNQFFRVNR